jgi:hypothetical protein
MNVSARLRGRLESKSYVETCCESAQMMPRVALADNRTWLLGGG